jgi:hypothetical protein
LTPAPTNPVSFPGDSENFGTVGRVKTLSTQRGNWRVIACMYAIVFAVVLGFSAKYSLRDGTHIASFRSTTAFIFLSVFISVALFFYVIAISRGFGKFKDVIAASLFPIGLFSLALVDIYRDTNWFQNYGDVFFLKDWINANIPFSRWLLGTTLLIDVFEFVNHFVFSISAPIFITAASAACMIISTLVVVKSFGNKAYVVLPITTPIWLLLSSGYDEYYPFIAGVFLVAALWILLDREFTSTSFFFAVAGVLPVIYSGFVLLGGFLILKLFLQVKSAKKFFLGLTISAVSFLLAIEASWPMGHSNYLGQLYNDLGTGDTRNIHNYKGSSMSESLPFYSFRSAFSGFHLRDVLFSTFFAGGIAVLGVALVFFWRYGKRIKGPPSQLKLVSAKKFSLPVVFLLWNIFYLVFIQAKLGPVMDIDLFFGQNLVLAIWCGFLLEKIFDEYAFDARARSIALSAVVSLNGPIVAALLIYGIQR